MFGRLEDVDTLIAAAHARGLKVIVDLVPNHTSSAHAWFRAALAAAPGSSERRRYVFRDGRGPSGDEPPNGWQSVFGGPAWTRVERRPVVPAPLRHRASPTSTGTTPRYAPSSRTSCGSGSTAASTASGSTSRTGWSSRPTWPTGRCPRGCCTARRTRRRPVRRCGTRTACTTSTGAGARSSTSTPAHRMLVAEAWVQPAERLAAYVRPDEMHQAFNFEYLDASWTAADQRAVISRSLAGDGGRRARRRPGCCPTTTCCATPRASVCRSERPGRTGSASATRSRTRRSACAAPGPRPC